jgi:predicted nucleotidyltransferase
VKVFYPIFDRAELVATLRERLPALAEALPLTQVVLFGSWAKGRATAFSDIDLLVVYADPPRDDAYKIVRQHLRLRGLEPHVYSQGQATDLQSTIARMVQDGIRLL